MAKIITITMPDAPLFDDAEVEEYVAHVADQIAQGFTSGHVGVDHHWDYRRGV